MDTSPGIDLHCFATHREATFVDISPGIDLMKSTVLQHIVKLLAAVTDLHSQI